MTLADIKVELEGILVHVTAFAENTAHDIDRLRAQEIEFHLNNAIDEIDCEYLLPWAIR